MRSLRVLLFGLLVFYLGFIIYTNRALFFSRFDQPYWKDRYEQSQWQLPMSERTLGDDGLFLYEGYRLARGDDPTTLNAEVPPLGKYLIGASIRFLGNGYWFGYIVTTVSVVLFFLLAKTLLKNNVLALSLTLIFALDPLVVNQFTLSMLDSLQLTLLLLFFLVLAYAIDAKHARPRIFLSVVAGATIGLFSETKFPLLSPVLLYLGSVVFLRQRRWQTLTTFLAAACIFYVLPYLPYFLSGHTIIEWLRIQKGIVAFYVKSDLAPNFGSLITTLIANRYQNLFTKVWEPNAQWSLAWPAVTMLGISALLQRKKQSSLIYWTYIAWFLVVSMFLYSIIPFWSRYLLIILPFLYLGVGKLLASMRKPIIAGALISILLIANIMASRHIVFPTPEATMKQFVYDWQHGFFQDMYERITENSKKDMSREEFYRFGKMVFAQGEIEAVTIAWQQDWSERKPLYAIPLSVVYHTRQLGSFTQSATLPVMKEDGQWRVAWQWNMLISDLSPDRRLATHVSEGKRGAMRANDGTLLAYDVPGYMVWVTPKDVDTTTEAKLLALLSSAFADRLPTVRLHHRYVGNTLSNQPTPLGVVPQVNTDIVQALQTYTGVSLTPTLFRWHDPQSPVDLGQLINTNYEECCSYLYATTTYGGISGIEGKFNDTLKGHNGGTLELRDGERNVVRTILQKEKRDGGDVRL